MFNEWLTLFEELSSYSSQGSFVCFLFFFLLRLKLRKYFENKNKLQIKNIINKLQSTTFHREMMSIKNFSAFCECMFTDGNQ